MSICTRSAPIKNGRQHQNEQLIHAKRQPGLFSVTRFAEQAITIGIFTFFFQNFFDALGLYSDVPAGSLTFAGH